MLPGAVCHGLHKYTYQPDFLNVRKYSSPILKGLRCLGGLRGAPMISAVEQRIPAVQRATHRSVNTNPSRSTVSPVSTAIGARNIDGKT